MRGVVFFNALRRTHLASRPRLRVLEAALLSACVFTALFFLPLAFECKLAPTSAAGSGSGSGSGSSGRRLDAGLDAAAAAARPPPLPLGFATAGGARRRLAGGGSLVYAQWNCPPGQYNHMATLLHSGQVRSPALPALPSSSPTVAGLL